MKYRFFVFRYVFKYFNAKIFFRKTKTYLPPRFMTTSQAASQILESAKQLQVEDSMSIVFIY